MAVEFLENDGGAQQWQVAFLSNTGVVRTMLSPSIPSPGVGLMKRGGRAGQWVVEVCGLNPEFVTDGERHGYGYPYRQVLCTQTGGAVDTSHIDTFNLTAALARTPLPQTLLAGYKRARRFAVGVAATDFTVMSVALRRTPPEAAWHFRFYDADDILVTVTVSVTAGASSPPGLPAQHRHTVALRQACPRPFPDRVLIPTRDGRVPGILAVCAAILVIRSGIRRRAMWYQAVLGMSCRRM
jgi:hypothetical protein